jgi:hypothetical protein
VVFSASTENRRLARQTESTRKFQKNQGFGG